MTVRVLGYGRASTLKQTMSTKVQTELCEKWYEDQVKAGRWDGDSEWLGMELDEAVSSKIDLFHRPRGQHILTELGPGDVLVVAKDSRAFRSAADAEKSLSSLNEAGIKLVILNLQVDTSTPLGVMLVTIISAVARLEREQIAERTREALDHLKRQGVPLGNTPPPGWHFRYSLKDGERVRELVPDPLMRKIGQFCYERLMAGDSSEQIASVLNRKLPKNLRTRAGHNRKSAWYSWRFINASALYYALDWPNLSLKRIKDKFGDDVMSVRFIREQFVCEVPPTSIEDVLQTSKGCNDREELQPDSV